MTETTTIFALTTAAGMAGVAVFRLSGPQAGAALLTLTGRQLLPKPRFLTLAILKNSEGEVVDEAMVAWFPAPNSFTGEDVVELHTHGGRAVTTAVVDALVAVGLTPAAPGEFSKRAFFNQKMDLTKAESIADLVAAQTAAQRQQALRQMRGELEQKVEHWRQDLLKILALSEAMIDFSDEDLPDLEQEIFTAANRLQMQMETALSDGRRSESIRLGIMVAILGTPNVGKSSLLNHMAGREAAIVSNRAGTTRDVIEVQLDLGGWPVLLSDTAGLRNGDDPVEQEGISRAYQRAESADINILVFDSASLSDDIPTASLLDDRTIIVVNKRDLGGEPPPSHWRGLPVFFLSAKTGEGVGPFLDHLTAMVSTRYQPPQEAGFSRARHRVLVEEAAEALRRFKQAPAAEIAAEDLRLAAQALGQLTGRVDVEEVLDVIFGSFCIGK